jgi:hypothetical protein
VLLLTRPLRLLVLLLTPLLRLLTLLPASKLSLPQGSRDKKAGHSTGFFISP